MIYNYTYTPPVMFLCGVVTPSVYYLYVSVINRYGVEQHLICAGTRIVPSISVILSGAEQPFCVSLSWCTSSASELLC